jgi:putative membrane protein
VNEDPRIFFAAERTLLAWARTSISLIGFGFLVERFGMFVEMSLGMRAEILQRHAAFWIGFSLVSCGVLVSVVSSVQGGRFIDTLPAASRPHGYRSGMGVLTNVMIAFIGLCFLTLFLLRTDP